MKSVVRSMPIGFLLAATLAGQEPVDPPATTRVRIVGARDGLPRPGVLLHHGPFTGHEPDRTPDGFLIAEAPEVRRLRAAATVRTDPAGEADLPTAVLRGMAQWFAGEPYTLVGKAEDKDGALVWQVAEREPVGVRVVDAAGQPVAGFPVALHSGGRDLSFALTDREGRAVLGMPVGYTARLCLAPAGWAGPYDPMPTIATVLPGKRGAELVLPPHGTLRFRALRNGQPLRTRVGLLALRDPDPEQYVRFAHFVPNGRVEAFGIELPRVAAGVRFAGEVDLPRRQRLDAVAPLAAGEVRTIDVVVPWSPELRGACVLPAGQALPAGTALRLRCGTRLLQVHCDVLATTGSPEAFFASLRPDFDLSLPVLDLGAIVLRATSPPHGSVSFADDQPAKGAWVVATPQPAGKEQVLYLDAEGRFCWREPLPRDADGGLLPFELVARRGAVVAAPVRFTPGDAAALLRLPLPEPVTTPPRPQRFQGTLVVTIADPARERSVADSLSLQGDNGMVVRPASRTPVGDGALEVAFRGIQQGRYSLCARDDKHLLRVIVTGLDVPGDGPCVDPRLLRVVLGEGLRLRTVRVVDGQGVPIAGATVRGAGFAWQTDGSGSITLAVHGDQAVAARFSARGHRDLELPTFVDGQIVQLPPAAVLRVRLLGLPEDLPRDRLQVWVRHEVRERLEGPRAGVAADGVAELPVPVAANYVLWLLVTAPGPEGQQSSTGIAIRPDPIAIGADPPQQVDWQLDAAAIERLRQELGSAK